MLLVEMKTGLNNTSVCALEPSGCTPLPSMASTVRTKEPSLDASRRISCTASYSYFSSQSLYPTLLYSIILCQGQYCFWEYSAGGGGVGGATYSRALACVYAHTFLLSGFVSLLAPLDKQPCSTAAPYMLPRVTAPPTPLPWQRAARLGEELLQDFRSHQCMQVSW
jgi:hypothetical protein